ncbi:hypothetical protein Aperf_G00000131391 [Anoplocephala perfoliata]
MAESRGGFQERGGRGNAPRGGSGGGQGPGRGRGRGRGGERRGGGRGGERGGGGGRGGERGGGGDRGGGRGREIAEGGNRRGKKSRGKGKPGEGDADVSQVSKSNTRTMRKDQIMSPREHVSYPAPTYYSHLAAFRARDWLKDAPDPESLLRNNQFELLPEQRERMFFL